jgi:hypothetical protein
MLLDRTLHCLQRIGRAPTQEQVIDELITVSGDFGVEHVLAGIGPMKPVTIRQFRQSFLFQRWPAEWGQRYAIRNDVGEDPVIRALQTTPRARPTASRLARRRRFVAISPR